MFVGRGETFVGKRLRVKIISRHRMFCICEVLLQKQQDRSRLEIKNRPRPTGCSVELLYAALGRCAPDTFQIHFHSTKDPDYILR